jgi:hypothetical protein
MYATVDPQDMIEAMREQVATAIHEALRPVLRVDQFKGTVRRGLRYLLEQSDLRLPDINSADELLTLQRWAEDVSRDAELVSQGKVPPQRIESKYGINELWRRGELDRLQFHC